MSGKRFSLDPLRALSYIGACALLAACPGPRKLAPLVSMPLAPASRDSAVAWASATLPTTPTLIRFRWRYQDEQVKYAGRGTARIAPPDSLRFDYVGPLGLGSGAAVVIGDSVGGPGEEFPLADSRDSDAVGGVEYGPTAGTRCGGAGRAARGFDEPATTRRMAVRAARGHARLRRDR